MELPHNLEQAWLRQLHLEYESICRDYRLVLPFPVLALSDGIQTLGSWSQSTRCLRISRYLIQTHSWSVVVQVLKHEIAHQWAAELSGALGRPHDDEFLRCCERLGVLPPFRRARLAICDLEAAEALFTSRGRQDYRVGRIRKLLALSESSHIHEAEAAVAKAHQLMQKYQIEAGVALSDEPFCSVLIDRKKKRIGRYQHHICRILSDFFFVRCIILPLYDARRDEVFRVIELLGSRTNVAIGEYCYRFLENQLAILWRAYKSSGAAAGQKNSYFLGVLQGVYANLQANRGSRNGGGNSAQSQALLVTAGDRLDNYVAARYPRLVRRKGKGLVVDSESYSTGLVDGRKLRLSKGVTKTENSVRLLLENTD